MAKSRRAGAKVAIAGATAHLRAELKNDGISEPQVMFQENDRLAIAGLHRSLKNAEPDV